MKEQAVTFDVQRSLVGIVTHPDAITGKSSDRPGVIILNAGLLHHVGPNRLYVKLARILAKDGYTVVRFDFSGNGDSSVSREDGPFAERCVHETQAAMDYLQTSTRCRSFIVMGICTGAMAALHTGVTDARVVGGILINCFCMPEDQQEAYHAQMAARIQGRYYLKRLREKSWHRLFTGQTNYRRIMQTIGRKVKGVIRPMHPTRAELSDLDKFWQPIITRQVDVALLFAEGSMALDAYQLYLEKSLVMLEGSGKINIDIIQGADHIFTPMWSQEALLQIIQRWMEAPDRQWNRAQLTVTDTVVTP